jgi:hypothetical protein
MEDTAAADKTDSKMFLLLNSDYCPPWRTDFLFNLNYTINTQF